MAVAEKTRTWRETDPGAVDRLMVGAIDLHCHSGPSVMPRYFDHYEAMQEASSAGIRALLIKDHYYSATPVTEMLNKHFKHLNVTLLSGVPLNNTTGGLNLYAVEHGIKLGAKLVWMPTFSSRNHLDHHRKDEHFKDKFPQTKKRMIEPTPLSVLDGKGKLLPEVGPILDLVAESDIVLSSGHLHIGEIWPLFEEAQAPRREAPARAITRRMSSMPPSTTSGDRWGWASMSSIRCACSCRARSSGSTIRRCSTR